MSHPYFHARSSARKFGGEAADYLAVHEWFDQAREAVADARRGALLHSRLGIFLCEQVFGPAITRRSDGALVPTRRIGEQHILEDLGRIPTLHDWLGDAPHESGSVVA